MKLYAELGQQRLYEGDSSVHYDLPKAHLVVTSPPYNLGKAYDDYESYEAYLGFLERSLRAAFDGSTPDARLCFNIPLDTNLGGYRPLSHDACQIAKLAGWKYRMGIVWNRKNVIRRTAWGSWESPSAPSVISPTEQIQIYYKDEWRRPPNGHPSSLRGKDQVTWSYAYWDFPGQNTKGAGGHPAPFPVELPRRCIHLFSYVGETVLDPFVGSGSTLLAAQETGRIGIGIDREPRYLRIASDRIRAATKK